MFPCAHCDKKFDCGTALVSHVRFFHTDAISRKRIKCCTGGCSREYCDVKSFSKHVKSHKIQNFNVNNCSTCQAQSSTSHVTAQLNESVNLNMLESESQVHEQLCNDSLIFDKVLTESVVSYVASLYDCNSFSEVQIQAIIDSHKQLLGAGFLCALKSHVLKIFDKTKSGDVITSSDVNEVKTMFESCENMFDGFDSQYLRLHEFENCGSYIKPNPYYVGHSYEERISNGKTVIVPTEIQGQFVSMKSTLKGFLELPGVFQKIVTYKTELENTENGILKNLVQGTLWKSKILPLFEDKIVLPLVFNFDDYECNKELGSHTGVHKLGAGYYRIPCIPPEFQGSLDNIFLATLFHSSDRSCGNDKVFRKVLCELQDLEDIGVDIVTDQGTHRVYFALVIVSGDNLGTNGILGFVECFSANYYCRICKSSKEANYSMTESDRSLLRTVQNYDDDIKTSNVSLTGLKSECVFNKLKSFHVVDNHYLDIMHDLDEGAWKYDMNFIIYYFVKREKRFSLQTLNNLIQCFYYGPNEERNKPPLILDDHLTDSDTIHCSASEIRCLVRYFGLIVGHLVSMENDKDVWNFYLIIRKIVDIVSAPNISIASIPVLKNLVKMHNVAFLDLFREKLYPKMHFMVHEAEVIAELGPLDALSCMRTEAKHREGKRIAQNSSNRKNLPLTVAKRHQLKFCHRLLARRGLEYKLELSVSRCITVKDHEKFKLFADFIPCEWYNTKWLVHKFVIVNGVRYSPTTVVCIQNCNPLPTFGQIYSVIVEGKVVQFLVQMLETVNFDTHVHAYEVVCGGPWKFLKLNDLATHVPTELRCARGGRQYVAFRYGLYSQ